MAKIKFGALAADARGKIDGVVYSRNQFGAYIRQKVSPVQPQTDRQLLIRERMTTLSKRFSFVLTQILQLAWKSFAASTPVSDVFGNSQLLSGIQAYDRVNLVRMNLDEDPADTPPSDLAITGLTSLAVVADAGGTPTFPIVTATIATKRFTILGDHVSKFPPLGAFNITGSTGNDGAYTVDAAAFNGTHTVITVNEVVASAVGDGTIDVPGTALLSLTFLPATAGAANKLYIFATPLLNPGRNFVKNDLRFIGYSSLDEASPFDATSMYEDKFGAMITGRALGVLVATADPAKGAVSNGLIQRTIVQ